MEGSVGVGEERGGGKRRVGWADAEFGGQGDDVGRGEAEGDEGRSVGERVEDTVEEELGEGGGGGRRRRRGGGGGRDCVLNASVSVCEGGAEVEGECDGEAVAEDG